MLVLSRTFSNHYIAFPPNYQQANLNGIKYDFVPAGLLRSP